MRTLAWLLAGVGALLVGFNVPIALRGGISGGLLGGITFGFLIGLAALIAGLVFIYRSTIREDEDASLVPRRRMGERQEPAFSERRHPLEPIGQNVIDPSGVRREVLASTQPVTHASQTQPIVQGTSISELGKPAKKESKGRDTLIGILLIAAILAGINECARATSDRAPTQQAFYGPAIVTRNAVVCYSREAYSEMQTYLSRQDFASIRRMPGCGNLQTGLQVEAIAGSGGFARGFADGLTGISVILLRAPDGQTAEAIIASDAIRKK